MLIPIAEELNMNSVSARKRPSLTFSTNNFHGKDGIFGPKKKTSKCNFEILLQRWLHISHTKILFYILLEVELSFLLTKEVPSRPGFLLSILHISRLGMRVRCDDNHVVTPSRLVAQTVRESPRPVPERNLDTPNNTRQTSIIHNIAYFERGNRNKLLS
jgi:hypothetical protein